jgi:hypothetical protein
MRGVEPVTAAIALAGWALVAVLVWLLREVTRAEARQEAARDMRRRARLSDTPHMRYARLWEPEP